MTTPNPEAYGIGWICAIRTEYVVACELLDELYPLCRFPHDNNIYQCGRIGKHHVVIASLPKGKYGITSAAGAATNMARSFPSIQIYLMVGIAGGAPSKKHDIRLGDVVVSAPVGRSSGVLQYDFGKMIQEHPFKVTGSLNAPPTSILNAVQALDASHERQGHSIDETIESMILNNHRLSQGYGKPDPTTDVLYHSSFVHPVGVEDCMELCQSSGQNVSRVGRAASNDGPVIHYGVIASANRLIKDAQIRDDLAAMEDILCFEMEAAGLVDLPSLVIRGICDYSDTHKNDIWQGYAAATAASYAKELINIMPLSTFERAPDLYQTPARHDSDYPSVNGLAVSQALAPNGQKHNFHVDFGDRLSPYTSELTADQIQRYVESLSFDQVDARYGSIKAAHSSTCRWLLTLPKYQDWMDVAKFPDHHGFLWCRGNPGTGKSTIMKFAFSHLQRTMTDVISIAFFFNARGDGLEKTSIGMYRSLLFQLMGKLPDLRPILNKHRPLQSQDESLQWDIDTLKNILTSAVHDLQDRSMICFIDALDECDDDEAQDMVQFFESLGQTAATARTQFRTLFSSRHYPYISIEKGITFTLEKEDDHQQDIATYLRSELKIGTSNTAKKVKEDILERASGIFLWVVLVVLILNKEYSRGRIHALQKRLQELPTGLERLFDDILTRHGSCDQEFILCLQWVLYARRPLKPEELYFAILTGTEPGPTLPWDPEEIKPEDIGRFILDSSKGLIEQTRTKQKRVQFIHESVREYFLKGPGLNRPAFRPASTFEVRSHDQLRNICHTYFMNVNLEVEPWNILEKVVSGHTTNLIGNNDVFRVSALALPLLEYAVNNVFHHSNAAQSIVCPQQRFLKDVNVDLWQQFHNLNQKFHSRRYYELKGLFYVLADQSLSNLIPLVYKRLESLENLGFGFSLVPAFIGGDEERLRLSLRKLQAHLHFGSEVDSDISVSSEDLRQAILTFPTSRDYLSTPNPKTLFTLSLRTRNIALAKVLLLYKLVHLGKLRINGQSAILWTVKNNYLEGVKLLVKYEDEESILAAAEHGEADILRAALQAVTSTDSASGEAVLLHVASYGFEKAAILLLHEAGVNVNCRDNLGQTPLHKAAAKGNSHVLKLLVRQPGIEINSRDNSGASVLHMAETGFHTMSSFLSSLDATEVNAQDKEGQTFLHYALTFRKWDTIDLLLAKDGIDPNIQDVRGDTPLTVIYSSMKRLGQGFVLAWVCRMVTKLLEYEGTTVNTQNVYGDTPFTLAVLLGPTDANIVRLLLRKRTLDINFKSADGETPLMIAAFYGFDDIVKTLLSHEDIDVDFKSSSGQTALDWAVRGKHPEVINLLEARMTDAQRSHT